MSTRTIRVGALARVEGEGSFTLKVRGGEIVEARLEIFEPPRFFEAFLRGRSWAETPDITARICGICPVAYQMSAVHAVEDAFGVAVSPEIRALRRLLYCGEWIESHSLHVFLLHAPDFLGYEDAISMAKDHPEVVRRGLGLKKVGNQIMKVIGGREIHPINVRVGGFHRAPTRKEIAGLAAPLEAAREAALATVRWSATLAVPRLERAEELVALRAPEEYPLNEGRIASDRGLDIEPSAFEEAFVEEQVAHSNALHARRRDGSVYLVGPLARFQLNRSRLPEVVRDAAAAAGLEDGCRNPFRSIVVRSLEILFACDEALRLVDGYQPPSEPCAPVEPRAGEGHACTEAPRGILYHRYCFDEQGDVVEARIVPPTSQNQKAIEEDLRSFAAHHLDLPDEELRRRCEQTIRNYDPCISCATHFLDLRVDRQ
ncbi:MAG: Ni/Fe hydrogenase subunit alpha [Deltaproteobacteria bacterium]|nr:Ni/Fe hydrogenase subunit alpha [Deltaproteobacteria bacterium]